MRVRGYAWAGLATDDFERTFQFFTEVMGLPVEVKAEDLAILSVGSGQQLEIFGGDHPGKTLTRTPVIAFEVDDVEAARDELRSAGIELIGSVDEADGYRWQYFRSPDGHVFEVKTKPS